MPDLVTYALTDGIATLTLDDGKANALSLAMSQAIDAGLDHAARDDARVVVLRGRAGVLCGGFDLKVIRGDDAAAAATMRAAGMRLLDRLYMLPQPLVIACTGHAVAAGGLILLTGDVRIGLRGAFKIGLNEVAIGLAMPQAGVELARDRIAPAALTEALLAARLYAPDDAARVGYLDTVVDAAAFDAQIAAQAQTLLTLDRLAFATTKRRLRQSCLDRAVAPIG